jgi:hypothetical protein
MATYALDKPDGTRRLVTADDHQAAVALADADEVVGLYPESITETPLFGDAPVEPEETPVTPEPEAS